MVKLRKTDRGLSVLIFKGCVLAYRSENEIDPIAHLFEIIQRSSLSWGRPILG